MYGAGGLETEADYPYRAENMKCQFESSKSVVNINGSLNISSDETRENFKINFCWLLGCYITFMLSIKTEMAAWLAANGPISIGINAATMQVRKTI